jgi:uncharacterized protein YcgI (DUF1989 family)
MDCVVVFSCCPQDMVPVNGVNCTPTDVDFEIQRARPVNPSTHRTTAAHSLN